MEYREYAVPKPLQHHVQCVWRLRAPVSGAGVQTIYPDGRCELVVHLATPPRCWDGVRGWHDQAANLFAAQRVSAVQLAATAPLDCVGVRLQPAASTLLGPASAGTLRERIVDLESLDAAFSRALRKAMQDFTAGDDSSLWTVLNTRSKGFVPDARIELAIARLEESGGQARIESVAAATGMGLRTFQMKFGAEVGLTPKEFARIVRLQATLRTLDETTTPISDVASERGFSDQAHATRELRRATGLTPARLRAELRRDRDGNAAVRLAASFIRGHSG